MKATHFILQLLASIMLMSCSQKAYTQGSSPFKEGKISNETDTLNYRYLLPENFDPAEKYPLVLFLHGAGERGSDNEKQLVHGSQLFLDNIKKYPAIVVFPQCPSDSYWSSVNSYTNETGKRTFIFPAESKPTAAMELVIDLVDSLIMKDHVDNSRVYIMGLSMGGMGTFELLSRRPDVFAAAAPICGGGNPEMVKKYNPNTEFWVFHGRKDDVVPPKHSTIMVLALQEQDFSVRYTLYHNANHNSWDPAFSEPELLSWMFSKTLNNK